MAVLMILEKKKAFKSDAEGKLFTKFCLWKRHGGYGRRGSAPIFTGTTDNKPSIFSEKDKLMQSFVWHNNCLE